MSRKDIGSDFATVDAYVNTPADYDELPDLSDRDLAAGVFQPAGVPKLGRPTLGSRARRQVTLRIDADALDAFKATGAGWQTRINDVLVEAARGVEATAKDKPAIPRQAATDGEANRVRVDQPHSFDLSRSRRRAPSTA